MCSLPASPRKRLCVVETLATTFGLNLDNTPARDSSSISISDETKQLVIGFYNSNDVSWQAPGRKDRIIVRESDTNGKKNTKRTEQVRYLLMSLKEAYSKFAEKHTDSKIGLSKFCEFRPTHVKLFEHIPHHVCVCVYHENVEGGSYPGEITTMCKLMLCTRVANMEVAQSR